MKYEPFHQALFNRGKRGHHGKKGKVKIQEIAGRGGEVRKFNSEGRAETLSSSPKRSSPYYIRSAGEPGGKKA